MVWQCPLSFSFPPFFPSRFLLQKTFRSTLGIEPFRRYGSHFSNGNPLISCASFAEDVFQTKLPHDPFNHDAWDAYRREFLQVGGGDGDLLGLLTRYLGRAPNSRALVDRLMGATVAAKIRVGERIYCSIRPSSLFKYHFLRLYWCYGSYMWCSD